MLGDQALALICGMLPPDGAKSGDHHETSNTWFVANGSSRHILFFSVCVFLGMQVSGS